MIQVEKRKKHIIFISSFYFFFFFFDFSSLGFLSCFGLFDLFYEKILAPIEVCV